MFKIINKAYETDSPKGRGFDSQTSKHNCQKSASPVFAFLLLFQIIVGVFLFAPNQTYAAASTWTGATSTDWGTATNWSLGTIPTSTTDVTIPDTSTTTYAPSISAGAVCNILTIAANGVLNGNAQTITVYSSWTNSGTFNHGSGKVTFTGDSNSTFIPGLSVYNNIDVNKSGEYNFILTVSGTATVAGNLTHARGSISSGQIDLAGNYSINSGVWHGGTTIINFNHASNNQSVTCAATGTGANIRIDKAGGIFSISSDISVNGWEYVRGTVSGVDNHMITFGGPNNGAFAPGALTYGSIRTNKGSDTYYTVTVSSGTLNVSGNLTLSKGNFNLSANNPNINLAGNLFIATATWPPSTFAKGTGTLTFNGTAPSTFTDSTATKQNLGTVAINKTNTDESQNKLILASSMTCNTLTVDGTAGQVDTLDLGTGGYILTLANAGAVATVFTLSGILVPGTSTVKYIATNSGGNINITSAPYSSLQLSGAETYALTAATTLTGNLTVDASSTLNTATYNLNVAGNFTNSGTFTPANNTVTLSGTNQTLTGNTSFYNLTKTTASTATLTFAASSTTTINSAGTLTLQGTNGNSYLSLRSATPATPWNLNVNAAANTSFNFLDIQDSNAAGGKALTAPNSINSNNNTNWTIIPPSTSNLITSFNLDTPATTGAIDNVNHAVALTVPYNTDVTNLIPTINVSPNATINPSSGAAQNFASPVTYRVTAQDGITYQDYTVTVVVAPSSGSGFVAPVKPVIPMKDNQVDIENLPASIIQVAVSTISDFKNMSWETIKGVQSILAKYANASKLYLKFRANDGGVSDIIVYERNSAGANSESFVKLGDGDIVKTSSSPDVYIIKHKNNKQYKRLILSPSVFKSYGHLKWGNLKIISQTQMNAYQTSDLVQVAGDKNIYELFPSGDTGTRRIYTIETQILKQVQDDILGSVYEINAVDRKSYVLVK